MMRKPKPVVVAKLSAKKSTATAVPLATLRDVKSAGSAAGNINMANSFTRRATHRAKGFRVRGVNTQSALTNNDEDLVARC